MHTVPWLRAYGFTMWVLLSLGLPLVCERFWWERLSWTYQCVRLLVVAGIGGERGAIEESRDRERAAQSVKA